ncbi:MAG: serine/threonine-protein kinase [Chloroflexota bacterium]
MVEETRFGGRYRALSTIAESPSAVVYLAQDELKPRTVVVKALRGAAATGEQARRWLAAAKRARTVTRPQVLPVYSAGSEDGRPWLAMAHAAGGSLRSLLAHRGALPPVEALELAEQVLAGLRQAHELGLGHGNLKPENVLFDGGTVKVADFGQRLEEAAGALPSRALAYAAPEIRRGAPPDEGADVYAFGALLYEMLLGRPPEDGAPRPRQVDPRLPPALDLLVAKALAPEPRDRWPSLAAVAEALDAFRAGAPARRGATTLPPPPRVAAPVPRLSAEAPEERIIPRWPMFLVGMLVVGLMVALVVFTSSWIPQAVSGVFVLPTPEPTRGGEIPVRVVQPTATPTVTMTPSLTPTPLPGTTYTPTTTPTRTPRVSATATPTPGAGGTPPAPPGG